MNTTTISYQKLGGRLYRHYRGEIYHTGKWRLLRRKHRTATGALNYARQFLQRVMRLEDRHV